jgi:hypothetical protein
MAIFEIEALVNETFTVSVWQLAGTQSIAPFSLATFDAITIPEPLSSSLAATALLILLRKRKI